MNGEDPESSRIWVAGYIVRDPSPNVSNWRAEGSLDDDLVKNGIVGLSHIDTRKLVRHLRSAGVMRAGIFSGEALVDAATGKLKTIEQLLEDVKNTPQMQGGAAHELHVEVTLAEGALGDLAHGGERLGHDVVQALAVLDLLLELRGLGLQILVGKGGDLILQRVHGLGHVLQLLELVAFAHSQGFVNNIDHGVLP